jgi:hypothetical protein
MLKTLTRTLPLFAGIVALSALVGAPAQAGEGARCLKASQCRGPLPDICMKCRNGHSACAHWACVHHRCVVRICPER